LDAACLSPQPLFSKGTPNCVRLAFPVSAAFSPSPPKWRVLPYFTRLFCSPLFSKRRRDLTWPIFSLFPGSFARGTWGHVIFPSGGWFVSVTTSHPFSRRTRGRLTSPFPLLFSCRFKKTPRGPSLFFFFSFFPSEFGQGLTRRILLSSDVTAEGDSQPSSVEELTLIGFPSPPFRY